MAGARLASVDDAQVAAGIALHHATDAAFHAAPTFGALVLEACARLAEAGVRRGPARAVAHIGTELLLDGAWVRRHGVPRAYGEALAEAPRVEPSCSYRRPTQARLLSRTCARIEELGLAEGYRDPVFVGERVARVLGRRPRLALSIDEGEAVRAWAIETSATVEARSAALWEELWRGLVYPPMP